MSTEHRQRFGEALRVLRKGKRLKHRELAAMIGISANSIGNIESGPYAIFGLKKLKELCEKLELDQVTTDMLVRLHGECPKSDFQLRQEERWAKHKEARKSIRQSSELESELALLRMQNAELVARVGGQAPSAVNGHVVFECSDARAEAMRLALIHVVDHAPDDAACTCRVDNPRSSDYLYQCRLCHAMRALGFDEGWISQADASEKVARICNVDDDHPRLTEEQAAAVRARPGRLPDYPEIDDEPLDDFG